MKTIMSMAREDWLAERRKGIGASECAAVMGFSPWKSAVELHYEKTGEVEPLDISDRDAIKMGIELEPVVASLFIEKNDPYQFDQYGAWEPKIFYSFDYPFMTCSPDGIMTLAPGGDEIGVELKTTSEYSKADWADGNVPYYYQLQCQHSMAVTGLKQWYIACLIGGRTYAQAIVDRDDDLIQVIIDAEKEFWHGVETKTPPAWDGSDSAWNTVKRLYSTSNGETIEIPESVPVEKLLATYDMLSRDIKQHKECLERVQKEQDAIKQELIALLGGAESGIYGDMVIEYKTVERKEHIVKGSSFRKFSLKKLKR